MPSEPVWCGSSARYLRPAAVSSRRGAVHGGAERLHHQAPVGLLVVADPDLPHFALEPEQRAGQRERAAPLAGARLCRELPNPGFGVVVRLGHRSVGLVAAHRAHPFVLVVDARGGLERLLKAVCPEERAGPPLAVDVEDGPRDLDEPFRRDLLEDEVHRKQRGEVVGAGRLERPRMERRRRRARQVGHDVVPGGRHLRLVEHELVLVDRFVHDASLPDAEEDQPTQQPRGSPRPRS